MSEQICKPDLDVAYYVGTSDDGVYFDAAKSVLGGWFLTTVIDCNTGSFIMNGVTDDGPYDHESDALMAGFYTACDWLADNSIHRGWKTEAKRTYGRLRRLKRDEVRYGAR